MNMEALAHELPAEKGQIRLLHSRESRAIAFAGSAVVKVELVDDRWLRYTVKGSDDAAEHCVGIRVQPLFDRDELHAIAVAAEKEIDLTAEEDVDLI